MPTSSRASAAGFVFQHDGGIDAHGTYRRHHRRRDGDDRHAAGAQCHRSQVSRSDTVQLLTNEAPRREGERHARNES